MEYFVIQPFVDAVTKLQKKNAYKDCEKALIKDVFELSPNDLLNKSVSARLNLSNTHPIAKIRVSFNGGKRGGYRLYLMAFIQKNKVYLTYLYPKTGPNKISALSDDFETNMIKELLDCYKTNNVFEVIYDGKKKKILYKSNNKKVF